MPSVAANEAAERAARVVVSNWRDSPTCVMRKPPLSIISAALPSHLCSRSSKTRSSSWTSSSISCGSVAMSGGFAITVVNELVQKQARNHVEGFKDPLALVGAAAEGWHFHLTIVEQKIHIFDRSRIGEIALVELQDVGNVGQV